MLNAWEGEARGGGGGGGASGGVSTLLGWSDAC